MTPLEAAAQAIREARERFEYIAEPAGKDVWRPRLSTERVKGAPLDCDEFASFAIERAHELCLGEYRFVTGVVTQSRWQGDTRLVQRVGHAWCAVLVDGVEHWFDPTPGWSDAVAPASEWPGRTAGECWRYAGGGQFVDHQLNREVTA